MADKYRLDNDSVGNWNDRMKYPIDISISDIQS